MYVSLNFFSPLYLLPCEIKNNHSFLFLASNPNACRAIGRGLQPKGVRVKEVADFKVYTKGAGSGELRVQVKGPSMRANVLTATTILDFFCFNQLCIIKLVS